MHRSTVRFRSGARNRSCTTVPWEVPLRRPEHWFESRVVLHVRVAEWQTRQPEVLVPRKGRGGSSPPSDTRWRSWCGAPGRAAPSRPVNSMPVLGRRVHRRFASGSNERPFLVRTASRGWHPVEAPAIRDRLTAGRGALDAAVRVRIQLPELSAHALLAQTAERLHGKEQVSGSIPLGGSMGTTETLLAQSPSHGTEIPPAADGPDGEFPDNAVVAQ